jgi:hypothetical protein
MKIKITFGLLFFQVFIVSCASIKEDTIVLEKSSKNTPSWIKENSQVNSVKKDYINLVYHRNGLYNLTLGLKQSQTIVSKKATDFFLNGIVNNIWRRLEIIQSENKNFNLQNSKEIIVDLIYKHLNEFKVEAPLAEDIYWERQQMNTNHDMKIHYSVWVLLLIPKNVYDKAFLTIARDLQNSKDESTVSLGKVILQQYEKR